MRIIKQKQKFFSANLIQAFLFLLGLVFLLLPLITTAASPKFLVSWQVQNYAPSWYQGKVLPIYQTPIEITFELVDGGKLADLSTTKIRWYINDKLVKNEIDGLGIKSLKIITPDYNGNETKIRMSIVDYRGSNLEHIVSIPVIGPEVVINAPYPDRKINRELSAFQAFPFFFNIKNLNELSVGWSANRQVFKTQPGSNLWQLDFRADSSTPSGYLIDLEVVINNVLNQLEFASKNFQLEIQ